MCRSMKMGCWVEVGGMLCARGWDLPVHVASQWIGCAGSSKWVHTAELHLAGHGLHTQPGLLDGQLHVHLLQGVAAQVVFESKI